MRIALVLRCLAAAVALSAGLGAWWGARASRADWLSSRLNEADRREATRLAPKSAQAWLRLADLRSESGADVSAEIRRAAACSPQNPRIQIQLGLDAEARHDYGDAERFLLNAVALDRDFVPVWTLANFYFRRGDASRFFPAARRTLSWGRADFEPVFRMCWSISDDGDLILRDAIPDRAEALIAYLNWLGAQNMLDSGQPVAQRLLSRFPAEAAPALLGWCDRLISTGRIADASALWNQMNRRHLVREGIVTEDAITGGDFHAVPVNAGFDWRIGSPTGVEIVAGAPGLNVTFSGEQPDRCDIADQFVLLHRKRDYRLRWRFERSGVEAGSGLRWTILDARSGARFAPPTPQATLTIPDFASASADASDLLFRVPDGNFDPVVARLALVYEREPGSAPMEGWIRIDKVWLEETE